MADQVSLMKVVRWLNDPHNFERVVCDTKGSFARWMIRRPRGDNRDLEYHLSLYSAVDAEIMESEQYKSQTKGAVSENLRGH